MALDELDLERRTRTGEAYRSGAGPSGPGFGVINITIVGWLLFGQRLDAFGVLGLGLVCAGIVVMHLFSGAARI